MDLHILESHSFNSQLLERIVAILGFKARGGDCFLLRKFASERAKWSWRGFCCDRMPYSAPSTEHRSALVLFTLLQDSPSFDLVVIRYNSIWLAPRIRTAAVSSRRVHCYSHCHGDTHSRHKNIMIQGSDFSDSISRFKQVVLTKGDFVFARAISKLFKYYGVHFLPFESVHSIGRGTRH